MQIKTNCLQSSLLSFENLRIEDVDEVDDDELAQITNILFDKTYKRSQCKRLRWYWATQ